MRKLILLFFLPLSLIVKGQTITVDGDPIARTEVIQVDSLLKKDQLFVKGLDWFASTFKDSKSVIDFQDKEAGVISGKTNFSVSAYKTIKYSVKLSFKDGKVKADFYDFISDDFGLLYNGTNMQAPKLGGGVMKKYYASYQESAKNEANEMFARVYFYFKNLKSQSDW